jgi:hypothetical protein
MSLFYSSLKTIYNEEGIRGTFRGLGPALMTVPLFWGIYFYTYDYMKTTLSEVDSFRERPTIIHVSAAVIAGAVGDIISNPLWVLRTRIQTLALHTEQSTADIVHKRNVSAYTTPNFLKKITMTSPISTAASSAAAPDAAEVLKMMVNDATHMNPQPVIDTAYNRNILNNTVNAVRTYDKSVGMWEMSRRIYQQEGIGAFYKGLNASFLGLSHVAVQFPLCTCTAYPSFGLTVW